MKRQSNFVVPKINIEVKDLDFGLRKSSNKNLRADLTDLNKVKNEMPFSYRDFLNIANRFDVSTIVKFMLGKKGLWPTNGEMKMHEILMTHKNLTKTRFLKTFSLAEFPGHFVSALINFSEKNKIKLKWVAQSLLPEDEASEVLQPDKILYEKFKENWLVGKNIDGDLTNPKVIKYYEKEFEKSKVDLVTADGGIPVSGKDYDRQEELHYNLIAGEILGALISLKKGGSFVLKIFSISTKTTESLIYLLRMSFDEVKITKPYTSRDRNDEKYIIAYGFIGKNKVMPVIKLLYKFIEKATPKLTDWYPFKEEVGIEEECLIFYSDFIKFEINFLRNIIQKLGEKRKRPKTTRESFDPKYYKFAEKYVKKFY